MNLVTNRVNPGKIFLAALLVVLVFVPRVVDLNLFLAHDEEYINGRVSASVRAVADGRWEDVLADTPGAGNLLWAQTGSTVLRYARLRAGGHDVTLSGAVDYAPDYDRLPGAVLCALGILAMYPFARAAFDPRTAYVLVAVIALDPYLMAESRVMSVEGAYAVFVVLALLAFVAYARTFRRRYLAWSGVWAAWATASNVPGVMLIPLVVVVLWFADLERERSGYRHLRMWVTDCVAWGAVWAAGFFVLWPRLWAAPQTEPGELYNLLYALLSRSSTANLFFMGKTWENALPGSYYIFVILYKTTPLDWLGFSLFVWAFWRWFTLKITAEEAAEDAGAEVTLPGIEAEKWRGVNFPLGGALIPLVFAALYAFAMAFIGVKQEHYMVCVVALLEVAASVGLVLAARWVVEEWREGGRSLSWMQGALVAGVVFFAGHALPSLVSHPYYYSYYNVMFGGASKAYELVQMGSGEGVDRAMEYLEGKPGVVVCGTELARCEYTSKEGRRILGQESMADGSWVGADYVVTYISGRQRGDYPPEFLRYLEEHGKVEHVVRMQGVDFATVYRVQAGD